MAAASSGCRDSDTFAHVPLGDVAIEASPATSARPVQIDAGIILSSRESYMCVSFEKCGLDPSAEVQSISTSCHCVRASQIEYLAGVDKLLKAILFEFVPSTNESSTTALQRHPQPNANNLAVIVSLQLKDGKTTQIELRFSTVVSYAMV